MAGSWRWALVLAWPLACLNPMPDDFPNQHEEDRAVSPEENNAPPATGADEGSVAPAPDGQGTTDGFEDDLAADPPDAGAPPADAGTEEDDASP